MEIIKLKKYFLRKFYYLKATVYIFFAKTIHINYFYQVFKNVDLWNQKTRFLIQNLLAFSHVLKRAFKIWLALNLIMFWQKIF